MDDYCIGVVGCGGRMGRMILRCLTETEGCRIAGGTEQAGAAAIGLDLGAVAGLAALGLEVGDNPAALFAAVDAVIDFTAPQASVANAGLAAEHGRVHVVGTTGLSAEHETGLARAAERATIVHAANMSLGVNLMLSLVEQVARSLDPDYDIEIVEMHHRHKVDAPSGTALALGRAAAAGRGADLDAVAQRTRDGHTGARRAGDIGFATLRGGDVTGEHSVIFATDGERIELTHKASTREVFARGAIKAALWARGRPAGLYSMKDVLGLS